MKPAPAARISRLEWIIVAALVAALVGLMLYRTEALRQQTREPWMRAAVAELRASVAEVHLQATRAGLSRHDGPFDTRFGRLTLRHGYPAATEDGLGRLVPEQTGLLQIRCASRRDTGALSLECRPQDLAPGETGRCLAVYREPDVPGDAPQLSVTLLGDPPCRSR